MDQDALVYISMKRWPELLEVLKNDYPRSILGYAALKTQQLWEECGNGYGFKVYCPFGDLSNGMVGINDKSQFYELIIQCPKDDTSKLEEAFKETTVIDWSKSRITVPAAPPHIISMLDRVAKYFGQDFLPIYTDTFILGKSLPPFEVSLPPGTTFDLLSPEHAELIESKWPHRYPGAIWWFQLLIHAKSAYGLFVNNDLVAWMLITECGYFNNLYTLEEYRRKGYGEIVVKLISNMLRKENKSIFGYVVKGNKKSFDLFEKLNFTKTGDAAWCILRAESKL